MARKEIRHGGTRFAIHYDIVNPAAPRDFIVLHGWGSSKEIMKQAFAHYLPDFRHIYIDMPGFGKSPTDAVMTTETYAAVLSAFLDAIDVRAEIIAGHSFGGKVALLLNPKLLILLSSAGIVVPKPAAVRLKIALFKLLKPFGGARLRRLFASADAREMPQNMYETFKNVVDEDFSARFAARKGPALLFWGDADIATPLWTGQEIARLMPKAKLFEMEGDHYFFLKHGAAIADIIQKEAYVKDA